MAKRKLSKQQQWRIKKIQEERSKRAARREAKELTALQQGDLGALQHGRVIAHYGQQLDIEPLPSKENHTPGPHSERDIHRCYARANIDSLVTGDLVTWRPGADQSGVIEARESRRSLLQRPDKFGQLKPVAANIDQILIVICPEPTPFPNLINRYLVAAEAVQITPKIILNKSDLLNPENREQIAELKHSYSGLGYTWLEVTCKTTDGLAPLLALLQRCTSVFVGQSGVGKSSIIKTLLPDQNIKVGALSEGEKKGTHTTTTAKLFHMPCGGELIDSPGIREFGLWHMDEQTLTEGFIEFRPFLGHCRFRDCRHRREPGCALFAAVEAGRISEARMASYLSIRDSLSEQEIYNQETER